VRTWADIADMVGMGMIGDKDKEMVVGNHTAWYREELQEEQLVQAQQEQGPLRERH